MTVYVSQKMSGSNRFQVNNFWVNILGVWTSETLMAGFLAIINVFFSFSVIHCSRAKPCDKVFWQILAERVWILGIHRFPECYARVFHIQNDGKQESSAGSISISWANVRMYLESTAWTTHDRSVNNQKQGWRRDRIQEKIVPIFYVPETRRGKSITIHNHGSRYTTVGHSGYLSLKYSLGANIAVYIGRC